MVSAAAPTPPQAPRALSVSASAVDVDWEAPLSDGGAPVTRYEVAVVGPDGELEPWEAVGLVTRHRILGLVAGHRYGFRVRAVNPNGLGDPAAPVYATPQGPTAQALPPGQQVPLLDVDRQSLIVRLDGRDCRLRVWWQPSDLSWYGSLEVPVNTPAVQGRRIRLNSGLLDRIPGILAGDVVCRALDDDSAHLDPVRDAWGRPTHGLFWEPAS